MNGAKRWDVIVLGGANTDYLVRGNKLPQPGETVTGGELQEAGGGKGANQAVAAARLGARVAFVGRIGRDKRGDRILDQLLTAGVDTRYVVRDRVHPSGVALILVARTGEKLIMVSPGANHHLSMQDLRLAAAEIRRSRVLLLQFEVPLKVVSAAATLASRYDTKVILDAAPAVRISHPAWLSRIHVLRANAAETTALIGRKVFDRRSATRAAQELLRRGIQAVALEAGGEGNLLVWPEGQEWLPKLAVKSVDATGAGDAFAAALAVAVAEGRSWPQAGQFANAAAALATTVVGAQAAMPKRAAVDRLAARHCATKR